MHRARLMIAFIVSLAPLAGRATIMHGKSSSLAISNSPTNAARAATACGVCLMLTSDVETHGEAIWATTHE